MIYPYKCKSCGVEFEVKMSVKQYETIKVVHCPICERKEVVRTFYSQRVSVHYKDDGFTKYNAES